MILLLASSVLLSILPIGAVYARTLTFPVIGSQKVTLSITSSRVARLQLEGRLILDEPVTYELQSSGEITFELTNETIRVLRAYRTTLVSATYDELSDSPCVVVSPPIMLRVHIVLKRVNAIASGVSSSSASADSFS